MHRYIERFKTVRDYYNDVFVKVKNMTNAHIITNIGDDESFPLVAVKHITNPNNPTVFVSGGVHGDEPAGIDAALMLIENLDKYKLFNFVIIPCVNPVGYEKNIREGSEFQDINREWFEETDSPENKAVMKFLSYTGVYDYALSMDLHETRAQEKLTSEYPPNERHPLGFHMWEVCPNEEARVGQHIIRVVSGVTEVCKWSHIWGDTNSGGVVYYPEGAVGDMYGEANTFENYMGRNYTQHSITTESYSGDFRVLDGEKLALRVCAQYTAVTTALEYLKRIG